MNNSKLGVTAVLLLATACGGAAESGRPRAPSASYAEDRYAAEATKAPASYPASPGVPAVAGGLTPAPAAPVADAPARVAASEPSAAGVPTPGSAPSPVAMPPVSTPKAAPETPMARPVLPEVPRLPQAGQLTAGVWDDNRNFDFFKPYASAFAQNNDDANMFSLQEKETARSLFAGQRDAHSELDVQLILDTTGSMGDELQYLQSEFDHIAAQVKEKFPQVTPRWSLVVYRDHGDAYVARGTDFTTNTNSFRAALRAQSANGGGDTPEAVVEGLRAGLSQGWRTNKEVAKVAFWVADAPAHPGEGRAVAAAIRDAQKRGVHIYPIASSDTDPMAEYQMRAAAQMTGGRYVFLTDDSGVGNGHAEPHIPCYNVTRLDHAITRMIQVELGGRYVEASSQQVLRQVGKPNKEGRCALPSGMLVAAY